MAKWQDAYSVGQHVEVTGVHGWIDAVVARKTASGKLVVHVPGPGGMQAWAADRKREIRPRVCTVRERGAAPAPGERRIAKRAPGRFGTAVDVGRPSETPHTRPIALAASARFEPEKLDDVCDALGIVIAMKDGARKPPVDDSWKPAQSWTVTLTRPDPLLGSPKHEKRLVCDFYAGSAAKRPSAADVIASLCIDSAVHDMTFEEWCADFDHDTDSRRAERLYNACRESSREIRAFLGEHYARCMRAEH